MPIDPPTTRPARPTRPSRPSGTGPRTTGHHPVNHAGFLYGAVVTAATLAVLDEPESSGTAVLEDVLAVVATLAIYYVVHVYTQVLGERSASGPSALRRVWPAMVHERSVLVGGVPATAVYLLSWLIAGPQVAVSRALQATVLVLGAFTWVLARRAGVTGWRLAVEVVAVALLGLLMIALKAALH